jgi:hypothetical protein
MKKIFILLFGSLVLFQCQLSAQETQPPREKYGNTLNIGVGLGYYGYGYASPALNVNYEFDLFRNFTLAPFIGAYTFQNDYYWGNPNLPPSDPSYHYYYYREVVIPVGAKGSYYFDQLFHANPKWDFYAALSLGFSFRSVVWQSDYYGDRSVYQNSGPLYLNLHIGSEYHLNEKTGLFLDLSTGISTFGVAVHF